MAAKSRRPAHRAVGLAVITLALLAVFGLSAPLRRSLRRASVDPDASALLSREINAALQHRQCPAVPQNGSALSVAFLHIPKTAGTSLVNAFKRFMPQDSPGRWCTRGGEDPDLPSVFSQCGREADGWVDPEPGHLKLLAATKRNFLTRCSGFSTHQDIRFFEQVGVDFSSTLTLVALRHPAERQISDYYYSMTARPQFMIDLHYAPKFDGDFRGLLKFAQEVGGDHQVRQLAGSFGCRWPGGPTTRPEGKKMLAVAKRNLERFCVVIIAELMHESRARLAEAAGWDVSELLSDSSKLESSGRVNGNPHPTVPLAVKQKLARLNKLEMQLYEHGVQLFLQRSL